MRRIRARSQHRPPFNGHAQQSDTDREVGYAEMSGGLLGIDNETAEQAERARPTISGDLGSQGHDLTIPATSEDPNLQTRKPVSPEVRALVAFLRKTGITAAEALEFTDYQWELASLGAKVNKPKAESRDQVVVELMRAEGVSLVDYDDPSKDGGEGPEFDDRKEAL